MLMYAHHVAVKAIPGPDAANVRVRPNTVRPRRMTSAASRRRRLTRREQMTRHFMVAALDLMRRFRPFLP
jgi:hypothetical protein